MSNYQHEYWKKLKQDVLSHYVEGELECQKIDCFEIEILELELHHVRFNGYLHRRLINTKGGTQFYVRLRQLGYPHDVLFPLIVLCKPCHKDVHGVFKTEILDKIKTAKYLELIEVI